MRIWHQSLVEFSTAPAYKMALEAHAAKVARHGTVVEVHGIRPGSYDKFPVASAVRYLYAAHLLAVQLVDNVMTAERDGFDAFAMVTLQDPAVREARTLTDMPVVGYGEAAMHTACMLGDRFGIVAFNPPLFPLWREQVHRYGLAGRSVPIVEVPVEYAELVNAFEAPHRLIENFEEAARKSIALGADVIIPGQSLLGQVLATHGVTRIDSCPVLDPLAVTIKVTETLVDLRHQCGISASRRDYYYETPPRDLIQALREGI